MDNFAMLTPHDQLVEKRSVNVLSRTYGTLCGSLEILGGLPLIHLDQVENHWPRWRCLSFSTFCQPNLFALSFFSSNSGTGRI